MLIQINSFFHVTLVDLIDILFVAIIIYRSYYLIKGTVAVNIFSGILLVYILWLLVKYSEMRLFGSILEKFIDVGFIALIVVFQPEIRRFLLFIGTTNFTGIAKSIKEFRMQETAQPKINTTQILKACKNMSMQKTGAIIVIAQKAELNFFVQTGDLIKATVSSKLIECIFYKNNPLHDGAIIINKNQIEAARCILPVTESASFPTNLGMRHRAAVGLTETTDAQAIVISEQTGQIAFATDGKLTENITLEQLKEILDKY